VNFIKHMVGPNGWLG